ncbi:MAG: D-xylose ABC transporter ATP-binding protein [Solibacterales bacterium]|nr:D-xylose ABC transporter ATP-binding protein [Bryobacterales bacterium]|tara:strand:- start:23312 stop:24766 length:1455 start_codon:yes stop_codon:yes gene_type:complete
MLLELDSIQKHFGGVTALEYGTMRVDAGEVHALVGENGAGKSTLMKIVSGMIEHDRGVMRWRNKEVKFHRPADAHAIGVAMVHQESLLVPHLTVAENIFLGREPMQGPFVDQRRIVLEASALIEEHHFPLDPESRVDKLSPAKKQLIEICRALHSASSLIIFDEPTSSLSESETNEVFNIVKALSARGIGIIYITHRLDELQGLADRITILRDGRTVHTDVLANVDTEQIVHHMVGREISHIYTRQSLNPGRELLKVDLPNVHFSVRAGEIVGVAGLMGAGRTELCQTIFGITPVEKGSIEIAGEIVQIKSPRDAVNAGIALITEDRQKTGLALELPLKVNVTLANTDAVCKLGFLQNDMENEVAEYSRKRLQIRTATIEQTAGRLSGGNQQKIVIAKWLFRNAQLLLFDEPTRGIDVGAKAEVFSLMDELAKEGKGIVMVSSELPELLQVADRILVMRDGKIAAELPRKTTQQEVMHHAVVER